MIYIVEGEEELFIKQKLNQICNVNDAQIINFDGNDKNFNMNEMIDACLGNSLFSNKTIVLVKDAPFLTKKVDDKLLQPLIEYVDNPVFETELVFYSLENKLNSRLKAYKAISKNAQLCELNSYDYKNFNTYVNQQINFNQLNINRDAAYLLNTICKRNATLLNRNIEILKNYPGLITSEVIDKLCTASDDEDSFEMINALTNKDISKAISIERKLMNDNDSINSVIGLLAFQLRFLYHLSYLISVGKKKSEIIDITKCSEGRYNKSVLTLKRLNMKEIINLLSLLSDLDISCKNDSTISDKSRFELFILNLLKKDSYASN